MNVEIMASNKEKKNPEATPEQIAEYQKLKARNEWIKMNQDYLDQIKRKQLFLHRTILLFVIINLIVQLLNLLL